MNWQNWKNWRKWIGYLFPYIERLPPERLEDKEKSLKADIEAIESALFVKNEERALDEAQRIAAAEAERVKSAETKATTYLAVMAALVPLVIALQAATWENKSGPAPIALKLGVLIIATIYVATAGYHAFKTLKSAAYQRVAEGEIARAWKAPRPLRRLTISTLLASRRSRDTVNAKVTSMNFAHRHMMRAFGSFVLLLLLDPACYLMGFRNEVPKSTATQAAPKSAIPEVKKSVGKEGADQPTATGLGSASEPEGKEASRKEKPMLPMPSPAASHSPAPSGEKQKRPDADSGKPSKPHEKAPGN